MPNAQALAAQAGTTTSGPVTAPSNAVKFYPMESYRERVLLMRFLEVTYRGGDEYKSGVDSRGQPLLIEHESEVGADSLNLDAPPPESVAGMFFGQTTDRAESTKLQRRRRIAVYENHARPIQDKIRSYVVSQPPVRSPNLKAEFERMKLDEYIAQMIEMGLKLTECWIGVDSAPIPLINGRAPTEAEVAIVDPVHKGKPYLRIVDPRKVVDFEVRPDGTVTRVVFEEHVCKKATVTEEEVVEEYLVEWTEKTWQRFEVVRENENGIEYDGGPYVIPKGPPVEHNFVGCPWRRFCPAFPTVDIAGLSRSLFNMQSLLDEEQYNSTFTQRVVTGARVEEVKAPRGSSNTLVIESPEATFDTVKPTPENAASLMSRIEDIRSAIYSLVSMEPQSKNVAESAEKKKRDMEALYTMLVEIVEAIEDVENALLVIGGFVKPDATDQSTKYGREFDVYNVPELLERIKQANDVPYAPPALKRRLALMLCGKLDPTGKSEEYQKQIEEVCFDISQPVVESIATMCRDVGIPAESIVDAMGVPDKLKKSWLEAISGHNEASSPEDQTNQTAGGNDVVPESDSQQTDSTNADGASADGSAGNTGEQQTNTQQ